MKEINACVFHWNTDKITTHRVLTETRAEGIEKIKSFPEFGKDAEILYLHEQAYFVRSKNGCYIPYKN